MARHVLGHVNTEAFELIEKYNGMISEELADHLGIHIDSARSWLSKWASRGYLTPVKLEKPVYGKSPGPSRFMYVINSKKPWRDL